MTTGGGADELPRPATTTRCLSVTLAGELAGLEVPLSGTGD